MEFLLEDIEKYHHLLMPRHIADLTHTLTWLTNEHMLEYSRPEVTIDKAGGLHIRYYGGGRGHRYLLDNTLPGRARLGFPCKKTLNNNSFRSHSSTCETCSEIFSSKSNPNSMQLSVQLISQKYLWSWQSNHSFISTLDRQKAHILYSLVLVLDVLIIIVC